ncbi:MAG: PKD domain-containing protein [candidate division KSB1 bacterium]|nr:PKD domain-containing protein [candidate division KSB1 bacterium]MDZ7340150.1 PKD domain-containing protein [candidate division KSB1 bacterium]
MKRVMFPILCILSVLTGLLPLSYAQQPWSDEIFISQGNTPDLVIDPSDGRLHLTVMTNSGVKYIVTNSKGAILNQEMVPNTQNDRGLWKFGASLAIDSKKMPHIGFRDNEYDVVYDIYYTYKSASGWSTPLKIADNIYRGYMVRLAADSTDRIYFAHGAITDQETITGPVYYYIIQNNKVVLKQTNINQIRGDERFEMDATRAGIVELVTSDFSYPQEGGPIFYWRSSAPGGQLTYRGDIHADDARGGANGSTDLFIDATGTVHVCYGAEIDNSVYFPPTVRYARIENGVKVRDTRVTVSGELTGWKIPVGVASIAASEDGTKVVVAYLKSETGPLMARLSENSGLSWGEPIRLADGWDTADARNKHIVRAYRSNFYVLYPSASGVKLRHLRLTPNEVPVAKAGGPYSSTEGTAVTFNASTSSDPDGVIVSYYWDFQADGTWDDTTSTPNSTFVYQDDFVGKMRLKVIDNEDAFAVDSAMVTITNVAPKAEAGGPYSGKWNTPIQFFGSAVDPGTRDVLTYHWDLDNDGIFETIGQNPQKSYAQGERHTVWLKAMDDDGGVGMDSALVIIANEPPVVSPIPGQSIIKGQSFAQINLDDYVNDPDNPDDQINWRVINNDYVNISIADRIAKITVKNAQWVGSDTVQFIATDPGNRSDTSTTAFTVQPSNQPPQIAQIPDQTVLENERFQDINLDDLVIDPDNADSELRWSVVGNKELLVTMNNRLLRIAVPDSEWHGQEKLTFVVSDPGGLKDSTRAIFTVIALNDPPIVTQIPDQTILPGGTFAAIKLDEYVFDADNQKEELVWSAFGAIQLQVQIINRIATVVVPNPDWLGQETIIFYAKDPWGLSGSSITNFAVKQSTTVDAEMGSTPVAFALHPNYPNPFNPETWISFDVPEPTAVKVVIYNRLGQKVRTLVDETKPAGRYQVRWNGCDDNGRRVSSGIYFYQLESSKFNATRKMILLM